MMGKILASILFIFGVFISSNSQNIRYDRFDVTSGLSHNSIYCLEVDSIGNIWAGGINGLNRYDGYKFEIFDSDQKTNRLSGNYVTAIQNDKYGDLWVAIINGGINHYNHLSKKITYYSTPKLNRFIMEGFNDLIIGNDSLIWIKNDQTIGLLSLSTKNFISYRNSIYLNGIVPFNKESILFYHSMGVYQMMPEDNMLNASLIDSTPTYEIIEHNNSLIAANTQGVFKYSKQYKLSDTLLLFNTLKPHPNPDEITTLALRRNKLWIGTLNGLYEYSTTSKLSYKSTKFASHSLPNERITRLKYDKDDNLWIGTINMGVTLYSRIKNQFKHYNWDHKDIKHSGQVYGTNIDPVTALCKTRSGDIWLGFESKGVGIITANGQRKTHLTYIDEAGTPRHFTNIRCIYEDVYNNVWIASWDNLSYYNKKRNRIEAVNYKYTWSWPYGTFVIKEFEPGKITMSGNNRIGTFDILTGKLDTLPSHHNGVYLWASLRDITLDSFNHMWIVQNNNGLIKVNLDDTTYTHIDILEHGLSDYKVYALEVQSDSLWIATNSGLDLFSIKQNKVIHSFKETDGLSSNVVYSVHLDNNNRLWMSTSKGISKLNTHTGHFTVFLQNDYFTGNGFFFEDEMIHYGGYQGVVSFNPKVILDDRRQPIPILDNFFLYNQKISIGDSINKRILLNKRLSRMEELVLNHNENSFSLSFNAYPFSFPNDHRFRYRLVNLQDDWVYPEPGSHIAHYTTVSPGEYTFQVEVSHVRDKWSLPSEISIRVVPPFWQTLWFKIVAVLFLILLTIIFIRYRIAQIRQINLKLEKRVDEQTRELKDQNEQIKAISDKLHEADQSKLRFFTNISHEFRTPLTLILGHISSLYGKRDEHSASIIRNNALRLLNLVNQLIEIRKMDQDKLDLNVSKFDLIAFTKKIIDSFQVLAINKNITLQFFSVIDRYDVWLDTDKMEKILFNLISNAIKYTPSGKDIVVEIKNKSNEFEISVEDNGIGISKEDLNKVFNRFYRSNSNVSSGHGIGLSLAKGLTEIQHGSIHVASKLNTGTRFTLTFKQGKDHFNKEDFGIAETEELFTTEPYNPPLSSINMAKDYNILVVEDNVELKDYIANLLNQQFFVKTAENGKEAIEILNDFTPDLIISDIMMPIMDGLAFCAELKSNIETSHIPFIMLTAKTDSETQIEGFTKGIDDYIEKPFDANVFIARINALLSNRASVKKHIASSLNTPEAIEKASFSKKDKEFWKKINHIINKNYHDTDFNTEMMSDAMHMSRTTFYRKFKSLTGLNAADHLRKFRLYKAAELLLEQQLDIAQVSISVGFKSLSQFRINFKQEFGKTPSEYQKNK